MHDKQRQATPRYAPRCHGALINSEARIPPRCSWRSCRWDLLAWIEAAGNHFELYYVRQPGGGKIDVLLDGASVLDNPLSLGSAAPEASHLFFDSPANSRHRVEVHTVGAGKVRILGFVGERIAPGVVYDVLGVNGARASRILSWNQTALAEVLANRKPDLIVLLTAPMKLPTPTGRRHRINACWRESCTVCTRLRRRRLCY